MEEGWYGDDYLILFGEEEATAASGRYSIDEFLPGHRVVGLRGWDDFILQDASGKTFCVPTVPAIEKYLAPYDIPTEALTADARFLGKIKWYINPVVFGGDPRIGKNVTWLNHDQHAQIVKWWNDQYRKLTSPGSELNKP